MKKINTLLFTCLAIWFMSGCSGGPQSPDFIKLQHVKIESLSRTKVVLKGDALFNNPNSISGKLTQTDIHIKVNDLDITDIQQKTSIEVPKNSEFVVPVNFSFNPKQLASENDGFLRNVVKSFLNKDLEVDYSGTVTVEVLGVSFEVPIDYSEKVSVGVNYD